jgi:hypothetical protein
MGATCTYTQPVTIFERMNEGIAEGEFRDQGDNVKKEYY